MKKNRDRKIEERETSRDADTLFISAMSNMYTRDESEAAQEIKLASEKGHKESQYIWSVLKDNCTRALHNLTCKRMIDSFDESHTGIGWYWCGLLSESDALRFQYFKKSCEAGYSWGIVEYVGYLIRKDLFITKDDENRLDYYLEILGELCSKNHPYALFTMGTYIYWKIGAPTCFEKMLPFYQKSLKYGWKKAGFVLETIVISLETIVIGGLPILKISKTYVRDMLKYKVPVWAMTLQQIERCIFFWDLIFSVLDESDTHLVRMKIGEALYWKTISISSEMDEKSESFIEYYIRTIEIYQKSTLLFVNYWNSMSNVKDIGKHIGKMVWECRYETGLDDVNSAKISFPCVN